MAVTPIGQRFEDDCKYYKMTFVEASLCKFNIFPFDRSEEENIPFDKFVMVYPESFAITCLNSSYLTQTNQLVLDNDDEHKVKCIVIF